MREIANEGASQVLRVEMMRRDYWDSKDVTDEARGSANRALKSVAAAEEKRQRNQDKYSELMEQGKTKKAQK